MQFGVNRLTWRDWGQQALGLMNAATRTLWVAVLAGAVALGDAQIAWIWWVLPVLFAGLDVLRATRIPHRDRKDLLLAASFLPNEIFMWLRAGWFVASWNSVLMGRLTHRTTDRWAAQYAAEGA
jgi:hypothetical protein